MTDIEPFSAPERCSAAAPQRQVRNTFQIPAMLKNGGGSIVNTSSFSGAIAFATIPIYVASKPLDAIRTRLRGAKHIGF